jgi:hypothetical protein
MSFTPIKRILSKSIQQAKIEPQVSAARVVDEAQASLVKMWGPGRAMHVRVISFKDGTLKVAVTSPAAAHTLRIDEIAWQNAINRAFGKKEIKKIVLMREGF